jgi:DNA modification methylase
MHADGAESFQLLFVPVNAENKQASPAQRPAQINVTLDATHFRDFHMIPFQYPCIPATRTPAISMSDNQLFFGDNLPILRNRIATEFVDLIYLDPPFNSSVDYNTFFAPRHGTRAAAQIKAFHDTWRWDETAERSFREVVASQGRAAHLLITLRALLGPSDMMAYLAMMTPRLIELHRVLKPTGTLYLHCDPTASHYLKIVLDAVFGPRRYLNELSWKRSSAHSDAKQGMRRLGRIRDVILIYTKSAEYTWNTQYIPYSAEYLASEYRHRQGSRFYKETDLTAAKPGGDTAYDWHVKRQVGRATWLPDLNGEHERPRAGWEYQAVRPYRNRYWAYSRENMIKFVRSGRIKHRATGMPRLMQFADEMPGIPLQDLWTDISPESGKEYLGYLTQKPRLLMERIVACSSNPGDVVLDPFCGCGTTIAAAQSLGRTWIGIDLTALAISLIRKRLRDQGATFTVNVDGEPENIHEAAALAEHDRHQFQWWAVGRAGVTWKSASVEPTAA